MDDHKCDLILTPALNIALPVSSTNTGVYSQARQCLPLELVQRMAQVTGRLLCSKASEPLRWLGRVVKMVDGTTVSISDTLENQREFSQHPNLDEGVGFPLARLVVLMDRRAGGLSDAAMRLCEGKGGSKSRYSVVKTVSTNKRKWLIDA